MNIQPACTSDCDTLVTMNQAMALETEGKALSAETLKKGVAAVLKDPNKGRYFVACEGDEVFGSLMVTREWSDWRNAWFWWIQSVYVAPAHRRKGVFRALYEEVIAAAKQEGDVCGVRLYVERDNENAQKTYRSLGMLENAYRFFEISLS